MGNVVNVEDREVVNKVLLRVLVDRAAGKTDEDTLITPTRNKDENGVSSLRERILILQTALGNVPVSTALFGPGISQGVYPVIGISGMRKLQQTL